MNLNKIGSVKNKKILFLQGPMGDFFTKLEKIFLDAEAQTCRIGLNAGDAFFASKHNYTPYRDTPEAWPDFICQFLKTEQIDMVFLFGDCRYYQSTAIYAAKNRDIEVFVFEEGYIRPDYITMERYGVNDYSMVPKDAAFYRNLELKELPTPKSTAHSAFKLQMSAIVYYFLADNFSWRYAHYKHHRDLNAVLEAYLGFRSVFRKYKYLVSEIGLLKKVKGSWSKRYFFVPLQTLNDFQILQHSTYRSVETFIVDVLESFAEHADEKKMLIFKHHPVDRGRKDYSHFICKKAKSLGLKNRVKVLHDVYLPELLKNALGTVTINSTVGLSSLHHETPVIAMGNAVYGFKGLSGSVHDLADFWKKQEKVDLELYQRFIQYLIENTQINGSFYGDFYLKEEDYK